MGTESLVLDVVQQFKNAIILLAMQEAGIPSEVARVIPQDELWEMLQETGVKAQVNTTPTVPVANEPVTVSMSLNGVVLMEADIVVRDFNLDVTPEIIEQYAETFRLRDRGLGGSGRI
jgi:hypothetical protein